MKALSCQWAYGFEPVTLRVEGSCRYAVLIADHDLKTRGRSGSLRPACVVYGAGLACSGCCENGPVTRHRSLLRPHWLATTGDGLSLPVSAL